MKTVESKKGKSDPDSTEIEELKKKNRELNQYLRELREEVHDMADFAGKVKAGLASLVDAKKYIEKTSEDVSALFIHIEELNKKVRSDTVRHISNLWEQIQVNPILADPGKEMQQQEQLHALTLLEERIGKMILAIGQRTIPHRLNDWLSAVRPGYFIPFHQLFESELPDPEDREKVLRSIALAPVQLNAGIVVRHSGLVYKYNPNKYTRRFSLALFIVLFTALSALIWAVGNGNLSFTITSSLSTLEINPSPLFLYWLALLGGIVAHVVVASSKQIRESGSPSVVAVNDWILLFSARKGDILVKIFLALFALIAIIFMNSDTTPMNPTTVFFIGYSLDSFIGLFGESMDQKATAQLATMRKKFTLN